MDDASVTPFNGARYCGGPLRESRPISRDSANGRRTDAKPGGPTRVVSPALLPLPATFLETIPFSHVRSINETLATETARSPLPREDQSESIRSIRKLAITLKFDWLTIPYHIFKAWQRRQHIHQDT